jgi:hypothetical protein
MKILPMASLINETAMGILTHGRSPLFPGLQVMGARDESKNRKTQTHYPFFISPVQTFPVYHTRPHMSRKIDLP